MDGSRHSQFPGELKALGAVVLLLVSACSRAEPIAEKAASPSRPAIVAAEVMRSEPVASNQGSEPSADQAASQGTALDPSFTDSNTRPEYQACVDKTGGETASLQACGDKELAWQDARLNRLYKAAMSKEPQASRPTLREAQRAWLKQTDQTCAWDAAKQGQGQMIDAQSCRLNRTTNRADELQKLAGT